MKYTCNIPVPKITMLTKYKTTLTPTASASPPTVISGRSEKNPITAKSNP